MARFCTQCGSPINEGMAFCTQCGKPVETNSQTEQVAATAAGSAQVSAQQAAGQTAAQSAGQSADQTVVLGQADAAPAVGQTAQMPRTQAPVIQAPVIQNPGMDMQQVQPPKKSKAPLIIGIVIAVIIVAAAAVVGYFYLTGQGPFASNTSTPAGSSSSEATAPTETKPVTYTVTFETNGGSTVSPVTVDEGQTVSAPQTPTRTNYTFDGWYTDSGLTQAATFPLKIEKDTTLYAKWIDPKNVTDVTITVVGRDGTSRTATIHRDGQTGRVFPDSNTVALTDAQVDALSDAERNIARNEIIAAANGYEFKNSGLKDYFNNYCAWYKPVSGSDGSTNLSKTASDNIELLKKKTDSWWLNLATN